MARGRRHITREIIEDARMMALRNKIRAEIALLDRQVHQHQAAFGVAYYNATILSSLDYNGKPTTDNANPTHHSLHSYLITTNTTVYTKAWEQCTSVVQEKEREHYAKEMEMEATAAKQPPSNSTNNNSLADRLQRASAWAVDTARIGQLTVEAKLIEREMRLAQEQFGVAVFDELVKQYQQRRQQQQQVPEQAVVVVPFSSSNSTTGTTSSTTQSGADVEQLIASAAAEVAILYEKREAKNRELTALMDEGTL